MNVDPKSYNILNFRCQDNGIVVIDCIGEDLSEKTKATIEKSIPIDCETQAPGKTYSKIEMLTTHYKRMSEETLSKSWDRNLILEQSIL